LPSALVWWYHSAVTSGDLERIRSLDGLRALACLAVFGVHLQQAIGLDWTWGPFDLETFLANGNTGVCLLMVLSGFLLARPFWRDPARARSGADLAAYAARRAVRILPAYFFCLTVLVAGGAVFGRSYRTANVLLHYTFCHNATESALYRISPPFWTMAVQVQFYVVLPALLWLIQPALKRRRRGIAVLAALACLTYAVHWALTDWARSGSATLPPWVRADGFVLDHTLLAHMPMFLLGMLAAGLHTGGRGGRPRHPWLCEATFWLMAVSCVAILGLPELDRLLQVPHGRYNLPYVPLLVTGLILAAPNAPLAGRLLESAPLRGLGRISFGFYLVHRPCMGAVATAMAKLGRAPAAHPSLFAAAALLASTAAAAAMWFALERPLLARSRRRNVR